MFRLKKIGILSMIACMIVMNACTHVVAYADYQGTDFMILLDVSGSMNKTDEERYSIETIKAVIDLCRDEDRVGVIAYNDSIVYTSELSSMAGTAEKEQKKQEVDAITFSGETDIGLGITQAVSFLKDSDEHTRQATVIILSDGETDLKNSNTGRTEEDSNRDVETGMQYFMEQGIPVHAIGFQAGYSGNMGQLSLLSAATGGSSMVVSGPFELVTQVTEIVHNYHEKQETGEENQLAPTPEPTATPEPTEPNMPPVVSGTKSFTLYAGDDTVYYDLHTLFQDDDKDSLSYELKNTDNMGDNVTLEGSVLTIRPAKHGEFTIAVCAIDQAGNSVETEIQVHCLPAWKPYESYIIAGVILGILFVTVAVCVLMVYIFRKTKNKAEKKQFSGFLYGTFIDLKSKNERPDVKWDLKHYCQDGVTLQELFLHVEMKEDLPQLERLCFYPSSTNEILLVHCMDGGVFVEERNISANVPAKIRVGETVYISFADNASELALKYEIMDRSSGWEMS